MKIENTLEGYKALWQQLETTRQLFVQQGKRYCLRSVILSWARQGFLQPAEGNVREPQSTDDLIWNICRLTAYGKYQVLGRDELPPPSLAPRKHREILIALVMQVLFLSKQRIDHVAVDVAYRLVFPQSTPLNVAKKRKAVGDCK